MTKTPPFLFDEGNPLNSALVSTYPANERTFRDNVDSWTDFEHGSESGRHKIPTGNDAARDAITDWEKGSLWMSSQSSPTVLQMNVGTKATPSWITANVNPITTRGDIIRGDSSGDAERLALGASGTVPKSDGTDVAYAYVPGYQATQVYTSSDTWNKPTGLVRVKVTVQGAGGGGAGVASAKSGSGGAAGGLSVKTIEAASLGSTETVTIGAGGAAGSAGGDNAGSNGSATTIFGAHATATVGQGGPAAGLTGTGGSGASGDINQRGGNGSPPIDQTATAQSGAGGDGFFGGGGVSQVNGAGAAAHTNSGAGGSGGSNNNAGGAGAAGIVTVEEFY